MPSVKTLLLLATSTFLFGTSAAIRVDQFESSLLPNPQYESFDLNKCKFNTAVCCYTKDKDELNRGMYINPGNNVRVCSAVNQAYHCHVSFFWDTMTRLFILGLHLEKRRQRFEQQVQTFTAQVRQQSRPF
jgi:hypothetical protein